MKTLVSTPPNVFKSRPLYFQIGCLVSLLTVYAAFELTFAYPHARAFLPDIPEEDFPVYVADIPVVKEKQPKKEEPRQKEPATLSVNPVLTGIDPVPTPTTDPQPSTDLTLSGIKYATPEPEYESVSIAHVEVVPVFPGCETLLTNEERKTCLSDKISALIQKHFKTSLAGDYGLTGVQKIYVQFSIDKQGAISNIKVQAPHPALEKEAKRVIQLTPQMQAGKHNGKAVEVVYAKPIIFKVQ